MPLHIADDTFTGSTPKPEEIKHDYLIFYSSIIVDGLIKDTFGSDQSPSALIIYVGDRPTWKTPANEFRGDPWKIESIPTIVKLKDGIEASRLVDSEISAGLQEFIQSA
ncbi:uncharacterized protein EV420DRAFT_1511202 [Desarmillaria tabescens]|uniref:Thioredoxin domain-containing protein n=1 Tax=Armillaria tabescens TaxID=1929756 RepID=A0AA39NIT9_ARMTA|nr:uncharacterized protein EV420DRAFT_1511202 [Desarmillaria tabescens]KAK0466354.1 hypothetical protein EV420DRAFT_1511202 [Desarmillaria tabescens]